MSKHTTRVKSIGQNFIYQKLNLTSKWKGKKISYCFLPEVFQETLTTMWANLASQCRVTHHQGMVDSQAHDKLLNGLTAVFKPRTLPFLSGRKKTNLQFSKSVLQGEPAKCCTTQAQDWNVSPSGDGLQGGHRGRTRARHGRVVSESALGYKPTQENLRRQPLSRSVEAFKRNPWLQPD